MDVLVLPILLILVAGAGRTSHANSETAMDYWQKLLPPTPMPPALIDLLIPHAGSNNLKIVKDSKNVLAAPQAEEELKEISMSYGSQGNRKDLSNERTVDMSQFHKDLKNKPMPSDPQTNKDIKKRLGGKHDKQKVMVASLKKNLAASPQNEESLKEISVSYGSKFEEGLKKISVSYGLEGKQDSKKVSVVDLKKILAARPQNEENLNEISVSYGSKLEEDLQEISMLYGSEGENDLKEISVSYGAEGEQDLKEISVAYGAEGGEDVKEIFVSYGQEDKDGLKKMLPSEGDKGDLQTSAILKYIESKRV